MGGLSARSSAIFHIREPCALNTISNIIGLAVAAGHRPLTRTREQEPMGRLRRTRTREPPGGAQPSPARGSWPGSSRRETRELEDGWMARTRAHPPRRLAMSRASRRSLKLVVRPAPPLPPEEALSWGMPPAVRIELLGRRTPDHNPPPEEGLMLARERPYCPRWLAGLSTPPIHPSPPGVASGGYGRPGCRGSPPPATGNNREQHSRAIGRRLDPGPSPAHGGS